MTGVYSGVVLDHPRLSLFWKGKVILPEGWVLNRFCYGRLLIRGYLFPCGNGYIIRYGWGLWDTLDPLDPMWAGAWSGKFYWMGWHIADFCLQPERH